MILKGTELGTRVRYAITHLHAISYKSLTLDFQYPQTKFSGWDVLTSLTILLIIILYISLFRKNSTIRIKKMFAVLVILYCSYLVSAPVYNHMRRPLLFHRTLNGPNYVDGRMRAQYLVESYIVAIASILLKSSITFFQHHPISDKYQRLFMFALIVTRKRAETDHMMEGGHRRAWTLQQQKSCQWLAILETLDLKPHVPVIDSV